MSTHAPEMPIQVDDETGVWTTDALPMLYVPRHFFVNNHIGIEEVLGAEKYAEILYKAGYKSAWHWCEKEAECHGLVGVEVFEHYMKRLSQRGWGLFKIESIDLDAGTCEARLDHSAFVYVYGKCAFVREVLVLVVLHCVSDQNRALGRIKDVFEVARALFRFQVEEVPRAIVFDVGDGVGSFRSRIRVGIVLQ